MDPRGQGGVYRPRWFTSVTTSGRQHTLACPEVVFSPSPTSPTSSLSQESPNPRTECCWIVLKKSCQLSSLCLRWGRGGSGWRGAEGAEGAGVRRGEVIVGGGWRAGGVGGVGGVGGEREGSEGSEGGE